MCMDGTYVWPDRIVGPGMDKLNEAQFHRQVIDTAGWCGFHLSMHVPYSRGMPVGWPDITLVRTDERAPEIIFFEVKGPKGQVKPKQLSWLDNLRRTGHHAYLVQPRDYDLVKDILRNVYNRPWPGSGEIDPELLSRLTMNQVTGARDVSRVHEPDPS
jgi:hypothetical protein